MFKLGTNIPIHHLVRYLKTYLSFLRHYQVGPKKVLSISPWWQTLPCHCTREGRWVHICRCSHQSSCSPSTGWACHRQEIVGEHYLSRPKIIRLNKVIIVDYCLVPDKQTNKPKFWHNHWIVGHRKLFYSNPIKINLFDHSGFICRSTKTYIWSEGCLKRCCVKNHSDFWSNYSKFCIKSKT